MRLERIRIKLVKHRVLPVRLVHIHHQRVRNHALHVKMVQQHLQPANPAVTQHVPTQQGLSILKLQNGIRIIRSVICVHLIRVILVIISVVMLHGLM